MSIALPFTSIGSAPLAAEHLRTQYRARRLTPLDLDTWLIEFARRFGPKATAREFGIELETARSLARVS